MQIKTAHAVLQPVDGVDFTIHRGEFFALVGESGCGKSMTALAINRLLPNNAKICQGSEIFLEEVPLLGLSENQMCKIRGKKIAIVFQDPSLALNPVLTIGEQVIESLVRHNGQDKTKKQLNFSAVESLSKVRIPEPQGCMALYPHQLSGGMKQRIVIAMALAQSPDLLVLDEPTTALDVTTQAQILKLIKDLNKQFNMAIMMITHDFGIVAEVADSVAVMYAGDLIEKSSTQEFLLAPKHPYTQQLFASLPERNNPQHKLAMIPGNVPLLNRQFTLCRFKDRCKVKFQKCEEKNVPWYDVRENHVVKCHWYDSEQRKQPNLISSVLQSNVSDAMQEDDAPLLLNVEHLSVAYPIRKGFFKRTVGYMKAVDDVSFTLHEGQTLAIVGESGCGKTSLAKALLRLVDSKADKMEFERTNILKLSNRKLRKFRSRLQMIFQDPHSSMDPRMVVEEIINEGMLALNIGSDAAERQDRIDVLLEQVGLSKEMKSRYPHEMSGGQKQRVAIARALAVGAQLIICDEPTSALDVSVQAQILNLLKSLQNDLAISYLFITHNIGVVNYIADYIAVMYMGKIVEYGLAQDVLKAPKHPYTQTLLEAVPSMTKTIKGSELLEEQNTGGQMSIL